MREVAELAQMRADLTRYNQYVSELKQRGNPDKLKELSKLRGFSEGLLDEHDIFWIGHMGEMLHPEFLDELAEFGVISLTNNKPIFSNRWVIPIKNTRGQVINLVGYTNEATERYVYGTGKYYDRNNTLFGLENFHEAYEKGWCIITEGITDTLSIRELGYKNTFAMCGTAKSAVKMQLLNRLRHGVIFVHDRDRAGDLTRRHWVTNRYFRFNVPLQYKDADATLHDPQQDNREWFMECLDMAIDWILQEEHNGIIKPSTEATML